MCCEQIRVGGELVNNVNQTICMILSKDNSRLDGNSLVRVMVRPETYSRSRIQNILVTFANVCSVVARRKIPPLVAEGISTLIERTVSLWKFRTLELGVFLKGLPVNFNLNVVIDYGICREHSISNSPGLVDSRRKFAGHFETIVKKGAHTILRKNSAALGAVDAH